MALVFFRMSLLLLKLLLLLMLMLLLTNTRAQHGFNLLFTVLLLRRLGLTIQLFVADQSFYAKNQLLKTDECQHNLSCFLHIITVQLLILNYLIV